MRDKNKLVCSVGVNDVGDTWVNNKPTLWYVVWKNMLKRCYSEKSQIKQQTYIGCSVCDEWKIASNFKDFHDKHYIEGYQLDKDILVDGNKIYSPETCRFIPQSLNLLFVDRCRARGEWPIGVSYIKSTKKFMAYLGINRKTKYLGLYSTPEEAHQVYLIAKKSYCRGVADTMLSEGKITHEIYDAVLRKAENLKYIHSTRI